MTVPSRLIDREEFNELMKQEGDVLPLFSLTAIPFDPPRPGGPTADYEAPIAMNVLLVNVNEPCMFKDKEAGLAFVLMNGYDTEGTFTYENFQDCHIVKGAWGYRLAPNYWDEFDTDFDLDDAIYRFNHGEINEWKEPGD